jgi:thiamine kinase-like enzyme
MTEEAAVLELHHQLQNAHQEREKTRTSAQAKETKLTADLEQYRIWYKAKTQDSDRMVDQAKELRNELENLKVRHFFCFVRATN